MRVTKKPYSRVIFFFRCKSCKPAYTTYSKKNKITRPDGFFVTRIYSGKKKLHDLQQKKKLHDLTVLLLHAFTGEKKITRLTAKKKITRPDGFLLHAFTAEKKAAGVM